MAKKKQKKQGSKQEFLSDEQYLKQRARTLEIGKCYVSDCIKEVGEGNVIVTRRHTGGRISMAAYLVDIYCLGVKRSIYNLRMEEYELEERLENVSDTLIECTYEEAHNWIYGAIAFAEEAGIKPVKSFALTQYMLEEDNDDVPLIEYEFGKDGKHFLIANSQLEASRYLPLLKKNLGEGNYDYIIDITPGKYDDDDIADARPADAAEITMAGLIADFDRETLEGNAFALGFRFNTDVPMERLRQLYIQHVKDEPLKVLDHLPIDEINMLTSLAKDPSLSTGIPTFFNDRSTFMEIMGFAESGWSEEDVYEIRVATDFANAVLPCIGELEEEDTHQMRCVVETIFEGMANLYGEITVEEGRKQLMNYLKIGEEEARTIITLTITQSLLMQSMLLPDLLTEEHSIDDYVLLARYGWPDTRAMHEKNVQSRSLLAMPPRQFSTEEIINAASNPIPAITNERQEEFAQFLREQLGFYGEQVDEICFNLWYHLQLEDEPDADNISVEEYFDGEILYKSGKPLTQEQNIQAMQTLHKYTDAIPRWSLCGYSEAEVRKEAS